MIFINDTRTTKQKLDDLTDDSLLDRMEAGFTNFRRYTDPDDIRVENLELITRAELLKRNQQ